MRYLCFFSFIVCSIGFSSGGTVGYGQITSSGGHIQVYFDWAAAENIFELLPGNAVPSGKYQLKEGKNIGCRSYEETVDKSVIPRFECRFTLDQAGTPMATPSALPWFSRPQSGTYPYSLKSYISTGTDQPNELRLGSELADALWTALGSRKVDFKSDYVECGNGRNLRGFQVPHCVLNVDSHGDLIPL